MVVLQVEAVCALLAGRQRRTRDAVAEGADGAAVSLQEVVAGRVTGLARGKRSTGSTARQTTSTSTVVDDLSKVCVAEGAGVTIEIVALGFIAGGTSGVTGTVGTSF